MILAFATCTATSGNGAMTGMPRTITRTVRDAIRLVLQRAPTKCFAAAVGTVRPQAVERRPVSGTSQLCGDSTSGFEYAANLEEGQRGVKGLTPTSAHGSATTRPRLGGTVGSDSGSFALH